MLLTILLLLTTIEVVYADHGCEVDAAVAYPDLKNKFYTYLFKGDQYVQVYDSGTLGNPKSKYKPLP